MKFGATLYASIYSPWRDHYINYGKLKSMLREEETDNEPWTGEDEEQFYNEVLQIQLEKVAGFQERMITDLKDRLETALDRLKDMAPSEVQDTDVDKDKNKINKSQLRGLKAELDAITSEVKELKKFSSINYTGFLKIAKKHDRKRGDMYQFGTAIRLNLSKRGLNSEQAYSPLLKKLSTMYYIIESRLEEGEILQPVEAEHQEEVQNGVKYTAYKFWVHPENLLELKTNILRRLPALVYSQQSVKEVDGNEDPCITSLYLDNPQFDLYSRKVEHQIGAASLRFRWYGQLAEKPDIFIEKKIVYENGSSEERKIIVKNKYIKAFIDGEYKMEKTVQKMGRQGQSTAQMENFRATAAEIQEFIVSKKLEPVLRANYTRTAFQRPGDDRVRISIDSDIAFVREDTLDRSRPCRDRHQWHRTDVDNSNMVYPFENINQAELSKFPFSVLEIKLKEHGNRRKPEWIEDIMGSHLVHSAPRFSKFVHGVASLFEDYVNNLPFWLSDLETDIRKDPKKAFDEEELRKAQQAEDEQVVGSFLGVSAGSPSKAVKRSHMAPYLSERAAADTTALAGAAESAEEEDVGGNDGANDGRRDYGSTRSSILPVFAVARYSRLKRGKAQLPEGVVKPQRLLKNDGELKIEPKVWLANERTFLKWQHICLLLGSLAISLYTAAGANFVAECMGIAYVVIAAGAGGWGYFMLSKRRSMIVERSGKDFDNMIGPIAVSVAMMVALILNFVFAYRQVFANLGDPHSNHTDGESLVVEL